MPESPGIPGMGVGVSLSGVSKMSEREGAGSLERMRTRWSSEA